MDVEVLWMAHSTVYQSHTVSHILLFTSQTSSRDEDNFTNLLHYKNNKETLTKNNMKIMLGKRKKSCFNISSWWTCRVVELAVRNLCNSLSHFVQKCLTVIFSPACRYEVCADSRFKKNNWYSLTTFDSRSGQSIFWK